MQKDCFEQLAVSFIIEVAKIVPKKMKVYLFSSPLSARSTDVCLLWHFNYREKYKTKLLKQKIILLCFTLARLPFKFIKDMGVFEYALYGDIKNSLLVIWSMCGQFSQDSTFKTPYISTDKNDALFVFGHKNSCGEKANEIKRISLRVKMVFVYFLIKGGIYSFFKIKGKFLDRSLLLLEWFEWVLKLDWIFYYYLEKQLSEVVDKYNIEELGCVHEMHSYARIVWSVANKYKAKGYTVQHAAITTAKRWMFCYPKEIDNGLELPDVIYVYNSEIADLLRPFFLNTEFFLGCSSRYAHWKNIKKKENQTKYYLFVTALPKFDNETVIEAIGNLLASAKTFVPFRLRLHPQAILSSKVKNKINSLIKKGFLEISEGMSLKEDIESAIAVIGMSTTVLEEALLLGHPVIQIRNRDYLPYINIDNIQGAIKKDYRDLQEEDLLNIAKLKVDSKEIRNRFGLDYPVVDYKRLFNQ